MQKVIIAKEIKERRGIVTNPKSSSCFCVQEAPIVQGLIVSGIKP